MRKMQMAIIAVVLASSCVAEAQFVDSNSGFAQRLAQPNRELRRQQEEQQRIYQMQEQQRILQQQLESQQRMEQMLRQQQRQWPYLR